MTDAVVTVAAVVSFFGLAVWLLRYAWMRRALRGIEWFLGL
jgi:hypothetical protein